MGGRLAGCMLAAPPAHPLECALCTVWGGCGLGSGLGSWAVPFGGGFFPLVCCRWLSLGLGAALLRLGRRRRLTRAQANPATMGPSGLRHAGVDQPAGAFHRNTQGTRNLGLSGFAGIRRRPGRSLFSFFQSLVPLRPWSLQDRRL